MNLNGLNLSSKPADQEPEKPEESQPPAPTETPEEASEKRPEFTPVQWTSHPIQRYTIGDFKFEKSVLILDTPEKVAEFEALYEALPIYEQTRIKKIDVAAAEAIVKKLLAEGGATKGIDSSTGNRAPNSPVGKGSLTGE